MLGKRPGCGGEGSLNYCNKHALDRAGELPAQKKSPLPSKDIPRLPDSKLRGNTDVAMWAKGGLSRMSNSCVAHYSLGAKPTNLARSSSRIMLSTAGISTTSR